MKVYSNFDLTHYNSYKLKARCNRAWFFDTEEEIIHYYQNNTNVEKILIGSGHNIILSRDYYAEDFIVFNGNFDKISISNDGLVEAEAGITMLEISEQALVHSLSGVEIFFDIPSSLGGAVVMNAGASGEEIKDVLLKVRYLDLEDLKVKEILRDEMDFQYRNSFFQRNTNNIVLKVWMKLELSNSGAVSEKMETIKAQRWAKQPKEFPNAGSVFKRPTGYFVGAIMDELELKGFTVGGAKISEKHGGFIINFDNATGKDIIEVITEVKKRVYAKFGVDLEIEQRII